MSETGTDTIAAIGTPPGEGAISVIRVSGDMAVDVVGRVFEGRPGFPPAARRQTLGRILRGDGPLDEVLLTYFPGPSSHTGEDVIEIACHGGRVVASLVLETVLDAGARGARPGEFTERAFLNGKIDLTQAEAVMDLISARTELAARAAAGQLTGALGRRVLETRDALLAVLAHVEADMDFPDEDIDPDDTGRLLARVAGCADALGRLMRTADRGRFLREGARLVIAGPPNVGKSSLLNRLLGYDRAITSETPGTTRDSVEEVIDLGGYPVRLIDTAGLREGADHIERAGVARTRDHLARADIILRLFDISQPSEAQRGAVPGRPDADAAPRVLDLLNKADLPAHPSWEAVPAHRISCVSGAGFDALESTLVKLMDGGETAGASAALAVNTRHRRCLAEALAACHAARDGLASGRAAELVAIDLREALDHLGRIVGQTDTEDLLGEIFANFCIGK